MPLLFQHYFARHLMKPQFESIQSSHLRDIWSQLQLVIDRPFQSNPSPPSLIHGDFCAINVGQIHSEPGWSMLSLYLSTNSHTFQQYFSIPVVSTHLTILIWPFRQWKATFPMRSSRRITVFFPNILTTPSGLWLTPLLPICLFTTLIPMTKTNRMPFNLAKLCCLPSNNLFYVLMYSIKYMKCVLNKIYKDQDIPYILSCLVREVKS
jgi:hypothetical protein